MPSSKHPIRVIGAYAAEPETPDDMRAYYRDVLTIPGVDGLEISWGSPAWDKERPIVEDRLFARAATARHVVTLVGAEATLAAADPSVGLASLDEAGRRRALDLVEDARRWVAAMRERGVAIVALELHAYPTISPERAADAGRALARSLAEIAAADWGDTAITIEHCDARGGAAVWRKGLLPLDVEIEAVTAARAAGGADLGIALNWGRSAIEARDPAEPERHAARLAGLGLLRGVIFSGATDRDGPFGEAWSDVHPPLHEQEPSSAMDASRIAATLAASGDGLLWDGLKVAIRPTDAPLAARIALWRGAMDMLP